MSPPHDHKHVVGQYHLADKEHVGQAIKNAWIPGTAWANFTWEQRAAIFLKAADLNRRAIQGQNQCGNHDRTIKNHPSSRNRCRL